MMRHKHTPLPRPNPVTEEMDENEAARAKIIDALNAMNREVVCECGRRGYFRYHGKGVRWFRPDSNECAFAWVEENGK